MPYKPEATKPAVRGFHVNVPLVIDTTKHRFMWTARRLNIRPVQLGICLVVLAALFISLLWFVFGSATPGDHEGRAVSTFDKATGIARVIFRDARYAAGPDLSNEMVDAAVEASLQPLNHTMHEVYPDYILRDQLAHANPADVERIVQAVQVHYAEYYTKWNDYNRALLDFEGDYAGASGEREEFSLTVNDFCTVHRGSVGTFLSTPGHTVLKVALSRLTPATQILSDMESCQ